MPSFNLALDIPPGIVSDDTTFATKGRWSDGNNVRFVRGRPQVLGNMAELESSPPSSVCQGIFIYAPTQTLVFIGGGSSINVRSGGAAHDISPTSGATFHGIEPSFEMWGPTKLLMCGAGGSIVEWDGDPEVPASVVPNAPENSRCILVTPERQVLAFYTNEEVSGVQNPMCIRGSDIEDHTDWTTSATNNAFEHILSGGGTQIVTAQMVGAYVGVWTDVGLYLGQFIGEQSQTYRFDRLGERCGAYNGAAVAVASSTAYWCSLDLRFWAWTPGDMPREIECPISDEFRQNVTSQAQFFAWYNPVYNEVWWFCLDDRDETIYASRYLAYSIADGIWFRGMLSRQCASKSLSGNRYPITVDGDGVPIVHEVNPGGGGVSFDWFIQSADQYLDEGKRRVTVRGCVPDFEDQQSDIALTLYLRDRPQSDAVTSGPYILSATDTKQDFRASGKLMAIRFSGSGTNGYARLGRPVFDIVTGGLR